MQALGCETIDQFVQRAKLLIGDKVTDGTRTWVIKTYKDYGSQHYNGAKAKFYYLEQDEVVMRDHNSPGAATIPGLACLVCTIPNLRTVPQTIRVYRYLVKWLHVEAPEVTKEFYPTEKSVREAPLAIEWVQRLDKCSKEIEYDCEC